MTKGVQYTSPPGFGQGNLRDYKYNQVARVNDVLHIAGQGGWNYETSKFDTLDIDEQIDQAFRNVDHVLKAAGGKGWEQVFRVNSYHISLDDRNMAAVVRNFEKWIPGDKPTWTCVQVGRLGAGDPMKVEIEVQAYDPQE